MRIKLFNNDFKHRNRMENMDFLGPILQMISLFKYTRSYFMYNT